MVFRSLLGNTLAWFNKLTSVFYASVLLLIMNFVITLAVKVAVDVMTKFIVNNRTDALENDINLFFTITNFKFICLSPY